MLSIVIQLGYVDVILLSDLWTLVVTIRKLHAAIFFTRLTLLLLADVVSSFSMVIFQNALKE